MLEGRCSAFVSMLPVHEIIVWPFPGQKIKFLYTVKYADELFSVQPNSNNERRQDRRTVGLE